jgi:hypothetical protein
MVGQSFVLPLFPFLHGAGRKRPLARALGVAVNFLRSLMTSDRHDLAVTRSKLCEAQNRPCAVRGQSNAAIRPHRTTSGTGCQIP